MRKFVNAGFRDGMQASFGLAIAIGIAATAGHAAAAPPARPVPSVKDPSPGGVRLFNGKLGPRREITVALEWKADGQVAGRYFYRAVGDDIPLAGRVAPDVTTLTEKNAQGHVTGKWSVRGDKQTLKGTWQSPDGKTKLPIDLVDEGAGLASYERARPEWKQPGLRLTRGATAVEYRQARKGSKYAYPHLTRFRDARAMRKMNALLDGHARDLGCAGDDAAGTGSGYASGNVVDESEMEISTQMRLPFDDTLVVTESWNGNCPGAAHPQNGEGDQTVYDLQTAKAVSFADLFRDYRRDGAAIRKIAFAARIAEAVANDKKPATDQPGDDDTCWKNYLPDQLGERTVRFAPLAEKKALQVDLEFEHSEAVCNGDPVEVSAAKLAAFAAPGGLLRRLAK